MFPKTLRVWLFALVAAYAFGAAPARASDVSAAIARVRADEAVRLVSVVAADIDADGDLDVVGSDRSLQLHVWVNDGQGHFTRREPSRSATWHAAPESPSVDDGSIPRESVTQIDPQTLDVPVGGRTQAGAPISTPMPAAHAVAGGADRTTRTPRAPPPRIG